MLDSIIAERVLDLGFREGLERDHGFCRRHAAALIVADRRSSGILGSSILYEAMLRRRLGRDRRGARDPRTTPPADRLEAATRRPPCLVCGEGRIAVDVAAARLAERTADPAWAAAAAAIPFCVDDLVVVAAAGERPGAAAPVVDAQLARLEDLRARLEGYADHSAQDRRHLMTDDERSRRRRGRPRPGRRSARRRRPDEAVAEPVLGRDPRPRPGATASSFRRRLRTVIRSRWTSRS